jgi:uncharacterized alkaline shock family protein YloU
MRFVDGLTLFFYTIVFLLLGGFLIAISLNLVPQETIVETLNTFYTAQNVRLIMGVTGLVIIFINAMVIQITMGKIKRERTIAFENPDGQVTISLTAIEDFIKRAIKQLPEVKELKPFVRASKKGISIVNRCTLFSDVNIPETTEKIQNIVKLRVQEMLGVEDPINIKVHVVKISHKEEPNKDKTAEPKPPQFRGSIEYGDINIR